MNRYKFTADVARKLPRYTIEDVENVYSALEDYFDDMLKSGKPFKMFDIRFAVEDVEERNGRNPSTGESIVIPAHKRLSIKPSTTLKDKIKKL